MNREFLTRLAAMTRKMGAPPFLQRVLTTFVTRTTLIVEGLAGIIRNPPVVQYPEPGSSNRKILISLSQTPIPLFSRQR
ncbi:MAG TPA: hypothetical protein PKZ57_02310 [Methanoregulaceae archaeon]|nr:hypothetical protein [Methanoregulaceae archaeon]HQM56319.1 hypothetical protein [Methanoregulaceae archaeon]